MSGTSLVNGFCILNIAGAFEFLVGGQHVDPILYVLGWSIQHHLKDYEPSHLAALHNCAVRALGLPDEKMVTAGFYEQLKER